MDQIHKDILRRNYMQLAEYIMPSIETVVKNLWMAKVISTHMLEDILEGRNTNRKKAMALLDLLPSRGPHAFDLFYRSLEANELFEAAYILKPDQRKVHEIVNVSFAPKRETHVPVPVSEKIIEEDELPDVWPSEDALNNSDVRTIEDSDVTLQELYKYSLSPKGKTQYYTMQNNQRGKVLIINNEDFDHPTMANRDGSMKDQISLHKVFRQLQFDVQAMKNVKCQELEKLLDNESKMDYSQIDCYIFIVLSHGHNEVIFGTDGYLKGEEPKNFVKLNDLREKICANKSLIGKPKLFFLQACQGSKKDIGHFVSPADRELSSMSPQLETAEIKESDVDLSKDMGHSKMDVDGIGENHMAARNDASPENTTKTMLEEFIPVEATDAVGPKLPSHADLFIALATTAGNLSWRNTKYGTWFIQAITFIFAKFAYKYDLNKLMTMVNSLVAKAETVKGKYKQVAEKRDTFTKTLYFFPGLPKN